MHAASANGAQAGGPVASRPAAKALAKTVVRVSRGSRPAWQLRFQEISNHLVATLREHAFGVELHSLYGEGAMAKAHNNGVALLCGSGRHGEVPYSMTGSGPISMENGGLNGTNQGLDGWN